MSSLIDFDEALKELMKRTVKEIRDSGSADTGHILSDIQRDNLSIITEIIGLYEKEDRICVANEIGLSAYSPAYIGDF